MDYLTSPVVYLENSDIDENGNIKGLSSDDRPIFIMIQSVRCFHCTRAKPWYQEFANANVGRVKCLTIQGDSDLPNVQGILGKVRLLSPNFRGFPSYVVINKGKKIEYTGGRKTENLTEFLNSL